MKKMFVMFGVVALGFSAACASVGKQVFQVPTVRFQDLQVQGVGLQGGTLDVVLSVYNPNNFRLDASRLTYRLTVDTTTLGEGVFDKHVTVNAGDSAVVHLPVSLDFAGLSTAGKQLMGRGSVLYRVAGDFTVNTPLGDFTRPYSQTGQFTTFGGVTH